MRIITATTLAIGVLALTACAASNKQSEGASAEATATETETEVSKTEDSAAAPISVAEALPKLGELKDKTITVSGQYVGNYGSGTTLTFRLVDSPESTDELECVFDLTDDVDLKKVAYGPLTVSGIVWNNQLVKSKIVE